MPTPPPAELAAQLVRVNAALHAHVTVADARTEQLIELQLSAHPTLSRAVIKLLPSRLARDITDDVLAHRELTTLKPSKPGPPIKLGPALAAARLRAYYDEGQRRSGIRWQVLAAVNFVESDFGRLREPSADGALGPMQFLPATWATYGRGNVHDPHAAILAAARFLHAAGGRHDERGALYHYNPSLRYVDAIERYAGRIRRDPVAYLIYYARRPIVG